MSRSLVSKKTAAQIFSLLGFSIQTFAADIPPIDREALVTRHNPTAQKLDSLSPFSVGNGGFAFTADITGLQTFSEAYEDGIALHTQSEWGWHSAPNPNGYKLADATKNYKVGDREVPYAGAQDSPAAAWLRANPHRLDLGRIGLVLRHADGSAATVQELREISQKLDLWAGVLDSRFTFDGAPVHVRTACHPDRDLIAVEIESPLVSSGRAGISIAFPNASGDWKQTADWDHPEQHQTSTNKWPGRCDFTRTLDSTKYFARVEWSDGGEFKDVSVHHYEVLAKGCGKLGIVCAFAAEPVAGPLPTADAAFKISAAYWEKFWRSGGAIDLSGSTDPRAAELERRIVLSQYLTAVNCAGTMPPQETGLVRNSWYGKFHLEMHWWHAAHFALWGRAPLLERSLVWYGKILPSAQAHAREQGYDGARWPKMVGPDGIDSPSKVAAFLIWQQSHPIYFAELCYRAHPDAGTLKKYRDIVFQTADFMASYARWDEAGKRYVLGPALIPAQESYHNDTTLNPTYELAYWHWALEFAQQWRKRLGMEREKKWDDVIAHLAKPTVRVGIYAAIETEPYTVTHDHPSMLAALGFLPQTPLIDRETMNRTLDAVLKTWDWPSTWGWDYPMMAMTAARLSRPDDAINALMMDAPKNVYLPNGHNYQDKRLPLYLPGNGGLLAAVAMMAAGWDGAPTKDAPGFPKNGKWKVHSEGLLPMP
jgi:protein-glucosylgalactosylhydroxylysine glucosidase